jgi:predicted mannosyl-3-phosphoglycerate phosphatase (HAD superfamily)
MGTQVAKLKYKIGNVAPTYVSMEDIRGLTMNVHRPVNPDTMKRETDGWQFSYCGVPVQTLDCKTKKSAVNQFIQRSKEYIDADDEWIKTVTSFAEERAKELALEY